MQQEWNIERAGMDHILLRIRCETQSAVMRMMIVGPLTAILFSNDTVSIARQISHINLIDAMSA